MALKEKEPYELLKTKAIYAILDGDTTLGSYDFTSSLELVISGWICA